MTNSDEAKQLLKEIRELREWDMRCGLHPESMVYHLPSDSFELLLSISKTRITDEGISIYGIRVKESP